MKKLLVVALALNVVSCAHKASDWGKGSWNMAKVYKEKKQCPSEKEVQKYIQENIIDCERDK